MILISCRLNDFCSKVSKTSNFRFLIRQLVTLWKREELLIPYLNQMDDYIIFLGVNVVYFRTSVCMSSVTVCFGKTIFFVFLPKLLLVTAWFSWLKQHLFCTFHSQAFQICL